MDSCVLWSRIGTRLWSRIGTRVYKKCAQVKELEQQRDILLEACKAWMKVESEMKDKNPCPDLALRANYRKKAVKLTEAAIAKCNA